MNVARIHREGAREKAGCLSYSLDPLCFRCPLLLERAQRSQFSFEPRCSPACKTFPNHQSVCCVLVVFVFFPTLAHYSAYCSLRA